MCVCVCERGEGGGGGATDDQHPAPSQCVHTHTLSVCTTLNVFCTLIIIVPLPSCIIACIVVSMLKFSNTFVCVQDCKDLYSIHTP